MSWNCFWPHNSGFYVSFMFRSPWFCRHHTLAQGSCVDVWFGFTLGVFCSSWARAYGLIFKWSDTTSYICTLLIPHASSIKSWHLFFFFLFKADKEVILKNQSRKLLHCQNYFLWSFPCFNFYIILTVAVVVDFYHWNEWENDIIVKCHVFSALKWLNYN